MSYEEIVQMIKAAYMGADASMIRGHVAVQIDLRGNCEGALYIEVKDGVIDIQPYEYYDHNAVFTIGSDTMVDILLGRTNIETAYNEGWLRIDGDLGTALLLKNIAVRPLTLENGPISVKGISAANA